MTRETLFRCLGKGLISTSYRQGVTMDFLGLHLLVEFGSCNRVKIDDLNYLEEVMTQAAETAGAIILKTIFQKFEPHGVSGVIMISSSHLTIHTWPEHGYAAFDVFTCGQSVNPGKAVDFLKHKLEAVNIATREFHRGIPPATIILQQFDHTDG